MKKQQVAGKYSLASLSAGRWGWFLPILALLAVFGFKLVSEENELLWRAQELNLWLPTGLYWKTLMQYPAGGASWLGTFLTQFFYYPWLGTSILVSLWFVICLLAAFVVLLVLFVRRERRADHPLISLAVFSRHRFVMGVVALVCLQFVVLGLSFLIPNYSQLVMGTGETEAGSILLPGCVVGACMAPLSG